MILYTTRYQANAIKHHKSLEKWHGTKKNATSADI